MIISHDIMIHDYYICYIILLFIFLDHSAPLKILLNLLLLRFIAVLSIHFREVGGVNSKIIIIPTLFYDF